MYYGLVQMDYLFQQTAVVAEERPQSSYFNLLNFRQCGCGCIGYFHHNTSVHINQCGIAGYSIVDCERGVYCTIDVEHLLEAESCSSRGHLQQTKVVWVPLKRRRKVREVPCIALFSLLSYQS